MKRREKGRGIKRPEYKKRTSARWARGVELHILLVPSYSGCNTRTVKLKMVLTLGLGFGSAFEAFSGRNKVIILESKFCRFFVDVYVEYSEEFKGNNSSKAVVERMGDDVVLSIAILATSVQI